MKEVDTSSWTKVGTTSAYDMYSARPGLLVQVPVDGMKDTARTARETLAWQDDWWRKQGHTGCVAIFVDRVLDQDPDARAVYVEETEHALTHALALIGGTFWGRVVATAFMRVRRHPIPIRLFGTLDEAMPWIEEVNRKLTRPA